MSRELAEEQMKRGIKNSQNNQRNRTNQSSQSSQNNQPVIDGRLVNLYARTISEYDEKYRELGILRDNLYEYYRVELEKCKVKILDTEGETSGEWVGDAKDDYDETKLDHVAGVVFAECLSIIDQNIETIDYKMSQLEAEIEVYSDKLQEQLRGVISTF
ncbi:MAG: hypothetical protein IJZ96_06795 [Lachnospiraceae bacterium]|nr:hypothetical protein [Lachnospiraceae bacterium]MBQ8319228.1 hypothetical protein [Lachnospiraceae bacterium]